MVIFYLYMRSLEKILSLKNLPSIYFRPDIFQSAVKKNLYLEFFFTNTRALINSSFQVIATGPTSLEEEQGMRDLVKGASKRLETLREYVVHQLSLYSALLETNSYFICSNQHLTICRFVAIDYAAAEYELKLYTIAAEDLPHNYKDKLYIGRDFISLKKLDRDHIGLPAMRSSLSDQIKKLHNRNRDFLNSANFKVIRSEYLDELNELFVDFSTDVDYLIKNFPAKISRKEVPIEEILEFNRRFRELKHILMDMQETAQDMERALFEKNQPRAVRYTTKFGKDIANYINYITFKVNGRISDTVNGIELI